MDWRTNSMDAPGRYVSGGAWTAAGNGNGDFRNSRTSINSWSTPGLVDLNHDPIFNDDDDIADQFNRLDLSNSQALNINDRYLGGNIDHSRFQNPHILGGGGGGGGGGAAYNTAYFGGGENGRGNNYIDPTPYSADNVWRTVIAQYTARGLPPPSPSILEDFYFNNQNPNFVNRSSPNHQQLCSRCCNLILPRNSQHSGNSSPISSNNGNITSLDNVNLMARSQQGRRNLQKILDERNPEKIQTMITQVRHHVHDLMKHQTGNNFIQNLFEASTNQQVTELVRILVNDQRHLLNVCMDRQGTRAMQNILAHLKNHEQKSLILTCLRNITFPLTKDANGHHVIQRCLDLYTPQDTMQILNVIADHCVDIAADKSGCCLLQHCFLKGVDIEPLNRIVDEITSNVLILSTDPYGNYVVQFIVGLRRDKAKMEILGSLTGNFFSLSMDKYGSHVVEKCLHTSSEEQSMAIIQELINSPHFLTLLQDPFGNFVAQCALDVSYKIRDMIIPMILMHQRSLQSHPHGKKVLEKINGFGPQQDRRAHVDANKTSRNCMH